MAAGDSRYERAVAAIDAASAEDPTGREGPESERAVAWVRRLRPDAGEALLLAARAHHLRRWEGPRSTYPEGRAGYLKWRRHLHDRHAGHVAEILEAAGYDAGTVSRVQDIVRKRGLGRDPEVQTFEDALCLVFVEAQLDDLAARLDRPKMLDVVRKTLAKMSPEARALAAALAPDDDLLAEAAADT